MYKQFDVLAFLSISLLVATLATAPVFGAPAGADREEVTQLLSTLGERYEILTLPESWVLRPSGSEAPFDVIEVRPGTVAVDGETLDRVALRELVGDDGDLIHSLAEVGHQAGEVAGIAEPAGLTEPPEIELEEHEEPGARVEHSRRRAAERPRVETDTRVSFGSSLTIEKDESAREVVVLGGSLDVRGQVDGDAVVVGGSADVQGEVDGSVTAVGGSVSLGPEALVDGDVSAIGGVVHREPGARIHGEITELSLGSWEGLEDLDWHFSPGWPLRDRLEGRFGFDWIELVEMVFAAGMLAFVVLLANRYVSNVANRAVSEPWKAGLVGLIAQVLFFPVLVVVFIVLAVSIIGIPLALLLVPASLLLLVVLFLVGYSAIALFAGREFEERFHFGPSGPFFVALLGVVLIQGWSILGEALSFIGGPIKITAWLLILMGFLIKYFAWTVGLGAVLLHSFSPLLAARASALPPSSYHRQPVYPPPPPPPRVASPPPTPPLEPLVKQRDEDEAYFEAGAPASEAAGETAAEDESESVQEDTADAANGADRDAEYFKAGEKPSGDSSGATGSS